MNIPSQGPRVKKLGASDFNTLDESIKDTFVRKNHMDELAQTDG